MKRLTAEELDKIQDQQFGMPFNGDISAKNLKCLITMARESLVRREFMQKLRDCDCILCDSCADAGYSADIAADALWEKS